MKEFMLIFIGGDYEEIGLSPQDVQARVEKWNQWVGELSQKELFVDGRALKNTATRVTSKNQPATDGPFVETKELVLGYFICKAKDIEHAKQLTHDFPDYDLGGAVEIREIHKY